MAKSNVESSQPKDDAPAKPKSGKKRVVIALAAALLTLASGAGGYFTFKTAIAGTPEEMHAGPVAIPFPMPAAVVSSPTPLTAADYQIISIFGSEAVLSTRDTLIRVKVGSEAPGLGIITAVEPRGDAGGGSVVGTLATIRSL